MTAEFGAGVATYGRLRPVRRVEYEPKPPCPCGADHEVEPRAQNCPNPEETS